MKTEYLVQLSKDFRRTIDYLETRENIDSDRLAFYGMSGAVSAAGLFPPWRPGQKQPLSWPVASSRADGQNPTS
jgi:hypothetical protein